MSSTENHGTHQRTVLGRIATLLTGAIILLIGIVGGRFTRQTTEEHPTIIAWVLCDTNKASIDSTAGIIDGHNISSAVRERDHRMTFEFAEPMPDNGYVIIVSSEVVRPTIERHDKFGFSIGQFDQNDNARFDPLVHVAVIANQ